MSRYGSRITDGGYQAPATDSAQLERGRPIKSDRWTIGTTAVTLELVPFTGGRPDLYEIALQSNDPVSKHSDYVACMLRGGGLSEAAYARTAELLDAGTIPESVILPPGARIGW